MPTRLRLYRPYDPLAYKSAGSGVSWSKIGGVKAGVVEPGGSIKPVTPEVPVPTVPTKNRRPRSCRPVRRGAMAPAISRAVLECRKLLLRRMWMPTRASPIRSPAPTSLPVRKRRPLLPHHAGAFGLGEAALTRSLLPVLLSVSCALRLLVRGLCAPVRAHSDSMPVTSVV